MISDLPSFKYATQQVLVPRPIPIAAILDRFEDKNENLSF
jgi:hypothetical protein